MIYNRFEEIEQLVQTNNLPMDVHVYEIKEKYGEMRVSIGSNLPEVYKIAEKYEELSPEVCEQCGEKGAIRDINGWYTAYCDSCYQKIQQCRLTPG